MTVAFSGKEATSRSRATGTTSYKIDPSRRNCPATKTLSLASPSRICVKNLPKYVSDDRLREYFSQKGEITDAKLMRTIDGKSRQFAFIGYRSGLEAQEAIKYFDRSFLDSSRIQCEIAHKVGDPNIPRPWSRYSVKTYNKSTNDTNSTDADVLVSSGLNGKGKKGSKTDDNEDPELREFLQVMQPRSNTKLWEDDVPQTIPTDKNKPTDSKKAPINKTLKKKHGALNDDATTANESQDEPPDSKAVKTTKKLVLDDAVSDMDYFKSRMKTEWSDSESSDDETGASDGSPKKTSGNEDYNGRSKSNDQLLHNDDGNEGQSEDVDDRVFELEKLNPVEDNEDEVLQTDRLFVRNLPYTATEDELEELFSKIGTVSQVHIVLDKQTKRSKGFAYIQYSSPEFASRALEELDNSIFQGRLLHVLPAKQKISPDKEETNPNRVKNFKEKREEERKASEAGGNTKAWNTFFMRPDTVVENIARKFGVSKSDVLDPESDDIAVRIALGETQVIAETKNALKNAGINVAALEEFASGKSEGVKRSNRVIIVKNLPYGSSEGELAKMFGKYGSLDKIILPSTKTVGVVVYLEPSDARAAFKGLAYKRYKDAPLYLEWAPKDVLDVTMSSNDGATDSTVIAEHDVKKQLVEDETSYVDIDPDRVESRSLFVKNLNFKTTEDSLKQHFAGNLKEGKIASVKIKKHVKNGKNLSMGFGFIEFDSVDTATRTCKDLQGTVLDGHALILQLCHAKKDDKAPGKTDKDKSSTKIIVRNVAFEATEKDLRQLFSPFGQIKRLRLPRKFENHRGFAFIEFLTKQEAQNALQALSNTHLYGRHLVLERAKEGETLEELRKRTAAQFTNAQEGFQTNLSKKQKHTDILDEDNMEFD
ncbi:unnamed protein product [Rhodiola kirilowii]